MTSSDRPIPPELIAEAARYPGGSTARLTTRGSLDPTLDVNGGVLMR